MTDARNLRNSALAQFRASPWPWRWTLVLVAVDLIWLALSPISLAPLSIAILLANGLVAVMVFAAADSFAQRPRLGFFIEGFVFLAVTFPYLRLFNHLTMSIPLPLADPLLAGIDRQIGFDWLAYVHWADGHPLLVKAMSASYSGLTGYTAVMFALLAIGPNGAQRCLELVRLFMIAGIACMAVGMFFPALTAMGYYGAPAGTFVHFTPDTGMFHIDHLMALRSDPYHVIDLQSVPGLVTFPSFHTAMGVIGIWCARGNRWLFGPSLVVNGVMIASTPIYGSHYGIDIIGGALMTICAIAWLQRTGAGRPASGTRTLPDGLTSPAA